MPYIKPDRRAAFDAAINKIVEALVLTEDDQAKGELNYVIYSIVKRYIDIKGMKYSRAPYEEAAMKKNGDV